MTLKNTLLLFMTLIAAPLAMASNQSNLQKVQQTCQCPGCDLQGINLQNFQPGSTDPKENPFAKPVKGKQPRMFWLNCNFSKANLTGANLSHSNFIVTIRGYVTPLQHAAFSGANLTGANLANSQFYGVDFTASNLSSANLSNSTLFLDNFNNANFTKANLTKVNSFVDAMHGWATDFSNANFTKANLTQATMTGNFEGANFTDAILKKATFTAADAMGKPLKNPANPWKGVNFTGANLVGAKFISYSSNKPADLSQAIFCHTTLSNGKTSNRNCPS